MRFLAFILALALASGCMPQTQPMYALSKTKRCRALHDRTTTWQIVGAGSAGMSGLGGVSTVSTDDKELRTSLAIASLVFAAIASAAYVASASYTTTFDEECGEKHD